LKGKIWEPKPGSFSFFWTNGRSPLIGRNPIEKELNRKEKAYVILPYGHRYFALYQGEDLICVTVYKKGALEVKRRLEAVYNSIQNAER
jgi:hypothetical protein